jgi:hypothetical protein
MDTFTGRRIGSTWAGPVPYRTRAVLIGRPGHVDAVNRGGLKLVTPTGT